MSIALPRARAGIGRWPRHLGVLALAWAALLAMFASDVAALTGIWWTSTTFGHCLFILPVVAWLVWTRRQEVAEIAPVGWLPGLAIVGAGGAMWLVGDAAGVALARQLGLVAMMEGAAAACLGPHVARALLFPLAYAFFAVPFGEGLEPPLQQVTVAITMPLLHLVGVPATQDGVLIHAGRYYFEVAEACSGAKFVLAMVAYGALVANVCFASWRRRAAFMAACVVVPVLANGVRAFGTIWAADLTDVEAATGFDHIVYGWLFFALVMALLMAAAWRWFDRSPDDRVVAVERFSAAPRFRIEVMVAGLLAVATAGVFPAWSELLAERSASLPERIALPEVPGWHRAPVHDRVSWQPYYPGVDHLLFGRYADDAGNRVDVGLAAFASQREGRELIAFGTGALRENDRWVRVADLPPINGGDAMRIVATAPDGGTVERVVATWYRLGTMTTADPRRMKIETALSRLRGRPEAAIALHVSAETHGGQDGAATIRRFLSRLGDPGAAAARIAGSPR